MRRADRLFEILQLLRRTRRPVSAQVIAEELEVSKRTIYRDIATLMAQRVPITGEAGIGYVLERGFDMPPLMLTRDELDAAALGAAWVASRGEPELARAALDLMAKIEAILPEHLRPCLLEPATSIAPIARPVTDSIPCAPLRAAIRAGHKVELGYRDTGCAVTRRIVWPVVLGYRDAGRILAAWCELRGAFRYFRAERITFARELPDRIPERSAVLRKNWRLAMDAERARYLPTPPDTCAPRALTSPDPAAPSPTAPPAHRPAR